MLQYLWSGWSTCFCLVLRVSIAHSCKYVADLPCCVTVSPLEHPNLVDRQRTGCVTPDPLANVRQHYKFAFSNMFFFLQFWNYFALPSGGTRKPASTEGNSVNTRRQKCVFSLQSYRNSAEMLAKRAVPHLCLRHCCLPSVQGQPSVTWKSHFSMPFFTDLHLDPGDLGKALMSLYFIILKLFCFGGHICSKILLTYCFLKLVTEATLCKRSLIWLSVFQASVSVLVFWPWGSIWI